MLIKSNSPIGFMPTLSSEESEKIEKALLRFIDELSNIKEVISKDELKDHLLRIIRTEFEGISETKLHEIYDLALERKPSMQVMVSLEATHISMIRELMKEISGIKRMLEAEKEQRIKSEEQRIKSEEQRIKSEEERQRWESEATQLKTTVVELIYGICISDVIKHLQDRLAEFCKAKGNTLKIPSSLVCKSPEADKQWAIIYNKRNLLKAQADLQDFLDNDVDSIQGTYQLLLLDILNSYCQQESIVLSEAIIYALLLKKERNVDLHIKLDGTEKDAFDIFKKLRNRTLENYAKVLGTEEYKVNTLNELWAIGKKLDLYNR
eukprot:NODE_479_length_7889_cov_0.324390.p2 type:complete len:322 gc:universal NODE_479_length_7889_cov_0.324390:2271-1306(-)